MFIFSSTRPHFLLCCTPLSISRAPIHFKTMKTKEEKQKRPNLTEAQRIKIIALSSKGLTQQQVACKVKCSQQIVSYTLRRLKKHHTVQNLPKSGRPRKISAVMLGHLKTAITKHQIKPRATLHACKSWLEQHHGITVKDSTLYAALHQPPMRSYIPQKKPPVSAKNREKRVDHAEEWEEWDDEQLDPLVFCDETKVDGRAHPGREKVYDKAKTPLHPGRMRPRVSDKSPSVNLWAAITHEGILAHHVYEGTQDSAGYIEILRDHLLPAARKHFGRTARWCLQHDNASIHKAKVVKNLLSTRPWKNVSVLDWPPYSPDLNVIENLWAQLKRKIAERKPQGLPSVETAIKEAIDHMN